MALSLTCLSSSAQRFAVFSDIHVTPGNANDSLLRVAIEEVNKSPYDAVIVAGDLTNEGSDEQLENVHDIFKKVVHPLYILPGNHENTWSQSATKSIHDIFGADRFVFEVDSLVVVGINCGPFMKMGDGHIKQEDLHWLRSTLDAHVTPGKRVLSINHYPLLEDLDNYKDYLAILVDFPVIGHLNGHYHRWRKYEASDIECGMVRALDMRDGNYGYTIVEVTPEWTHIYNKNIGQAAEPKYAFANRTKHKAIELQPVAKDVKAPEGFNVLRVWADSASVFTRLGFDKENVFFANSLGEVKAVSKNDGQLVWSKKMPDGAAIFARPVYLGKNRVAVPYASGLAVMESNTGKMLRNYPSKEGPYVADGVLSPDGNYVQGGYKRIEKRNRQNGKLIWTYDSIFNYCQAAPAVSGDDLVFGAWDTNLRCLSLKTGKLKWVWNNGKKANMLGPGNVVPVITEDKVFTVAPDRFMTALDRRTGKQIWRDNSRRYRESLGHSADMSRVYAKTMDGELVAVDATSPEFRELWCVDMGLGYEHAPCIVAEQDGIVYAGSRRGIVTAVDPVAKKVLWSLTLGASEINGIDIDLESGDVFVSLIEGSIWRISKQ